MCSDYNKIDFEILIEKYLEHFQIFEDKPCIFE